MFVLILSLIILASVLLVLVILAQNSKGGGLSSQFGGSGASNMIGVKKTGDLLERLTWGLIIVIFALSMSTNFLGEAQGPTDEFIDRAQESQTAPALDLGVGSDNQGDAPVDVTTEPATDNEDNGLVDDLSNEPEEN
ncbi:preprotein translocase subunit SecG [Fulvivirga sp. M361]|uniref:preprotein translocase subunit SecG n=1 Tax=Fulvivirga sp. M361 TaxID=2594266 RepID=UPI001179FA1A|nr:preprotein translocase subunit SecG [Fulvivirga sp. M361]TRX48129.1 preprotein translocase subunit SecG [Fulvivirga sp. M361]